MIKILTEFGGIVLADEIEIRPNGVYYKRKEVTKSIDPDEPDKVRIFEGYYANETYKIL